MAFGTGLLLFEIIRYMHGHWRVWDHLGLVGVGIERVCRVDFVWGLEVWGVEGWMGWMGL